MNEIQKREDALFEQLKRGYSVDPINGVLKDKLNLNNKDNEKWFTLSWSHYLVLMRIENPDERHFYEIECQQQNWSVRQLQRQYASSLYKRLALSRDKGEVMRLANDGQTMEKPSDVIKSPVTLEFLGLKDPNDEPASVLLDRIRTEKERLIKEGKIKKPKIAKATCDKAAYHKQETALLKKILYRNGIKSI